MNKQIKQVEEFHETFGQLINKTPKIPKEKICSLRHDLLLEEVYELNDGLIERDMVKISDGIVDCLYILFGTINSLGLQDVIEKMFDEVHASNMSKLEDGEVLYREDGKILKGKNYFKPDLKQFLT